MLDNNSLVNTYAAAVRARPLVKQLPPGLREYALEFEALCLEDIRRQTGNLELTEADVLATVQPAGLQLLRTITPVLLDLSNVLIKKYWPAATASMASAALSYLAATLLQK